jgi:hypothetical protein
MPKIHVSTMTYNESYNMPQKARNLPVNVLKPYFRRHPSFEVMDVEKRFSSPSTSIGEHSNDYTIFTYLNNDAMIYWLLRLIEYLISKAPADSFHFELIIMHLAKHGLSENLRRIASDEERRIIYEFLLWMADNTYVTSDPPDRAAEYQLALGLWG